jgi:dTDP-4-dehydrorhamnose reductase
MRILLLGSQGQVGWELQRSLVPLGEVIAPSRNTPGQLPTDLAHPSTLAALVRTVKPDVIVNAAAHTAVDKAQSETELARAINATSPGVLAQEALASGAWLVHYSTDYVFDGSGQTPWQENAPTAPLNVYGHTKLEGEALIRASGCQHLILRTSWVYSARGHNFARTMLRLAAERDQLSVINDQIGAPTGAELLADVTAHLLRAVHQAPALSGTYHCTASGETSWHGYAQFVIEWARAHGHALRVPPTGIQAVPSSAFATAAPRPLNSRLSCHKLAQTFGLALPAWQHGVERMLLEVLQTPA